MPPRDANILHMLEELVSLGLGLTKVEEMFVDALYEHVKRGGTLNADQFTRLEKIYSERVR